jgi:hypothetical protein
MKAFVLKTRLEALRQNLEQVKNTVEGFVEKDPIKHGAPTPKNANQSQDSRSELAKLDGLLEDQFRSQLANLRTNIGVSVVVLKNAVVFNEYEKVPITLECLEKAEKDVQGLLEEWLRAKAIINSMKARSVLITDGIGKTLNHELVSNARKCVEILEEIERKDLKSAEEAAANGDPAQANNLLEAAWSRYMSAGLSKSKPVFDEYLDFLAGLALRDGGFDGQMCQMADELIAKVERMAELCVGSLAIPTHHEIVSSTLARSLIRLGYPEWTIWALPLVAHEFGHVLAQNQGIQGLIERESSALAALYRREQIDDANNQFRYYLEEHIADIFATYMMGPAYACAAILLRLELSFTNRTELIQPPPAQRAAVIFATLDKINSEGMHRPYTSIIQKLKVEWEAALTQTKQISNSRPELNAILERCLEHTYRILNASGFLNPPTAAILNDWPRKLSSQHEKIQVTGNDDLREVLNAAWICRLENMAPVAEIRHATERLWKEILSERQRGKVSRNRAKDPI